MAQDEYCEELEDAKENQPYVDGLKEFGFITFNDFTEFVLKTLKPSLAPKVTSGRLPNGTDVNASSMFTYSNRNNQVVFTSKQFTGTIEYYSNANVYPTWQENLILGFTGNKDGIGAVLYKEKTSQRDQFGDRVRGKYKSTPLAVYAFQGGEWKMEEKKPGLLNGRLLADLARVTILAKNQELLSSGAVTEDELLKAVKAAPKKKTKAI